MEGKKHQIRLWTPEEHQEIMMMEKAISKETEGWQVDDEPLRSFQKLLIPEKGGYIVSLDPISKKPSGMISFTVSDRSRGWVQSLYIKPEFRGKGIFRAFFQRVFQEVKLLGSSSIRLEVECDNLRAKAAYQHIGFECSGELSFAVDFFYGDSLTKNEILEMKFHEYEIKKSSEIKLSILQSLRPIMKRESNFQSGYACIRNGDVIGYFDYEIHLSSWRGVNSATILNMYAGQSFSEVDIFFMMKNIIQQCDPGQIFFFLLDKSDSTIVDLFPKGKMKSYDTMKYDL